MRTLILALLLSGAALSAQQPGRQDKLIALLKAMNMEPVLQSMIQQQMDMMKKLAPKVPPKVWDELAKDLKVEELLVSSADIYAKHFTDAEIDDLLRFYDSPTGKKAIAKMPTIMNESMEMGRAWGQRVANRVGERLKAEGYLDTPQKPQ